MTRSLYLSTLLFVFISISLPWSVHAVESEDISILFSNTIAHNVRATGQDLPEVLLTPFGYTNVTTVVTAANFLTEWENRDNYSGLIFAYHSFNKDAALAKWLVDEGANIEQWVKSGGMLITTAGRDDEEKPLSDLFGLKYSDPGTGQEEIVPVEPGTPFAKDIADNQMDSSESTDNNPLNGEIYDEPLPNWVEYVVTRNAAGQVTSVAGHYGEGVLWLGAGFEMTNVNTGLDGELSKFTGYKTLWENFMEWATSSNVSVADKPATLSTWGEVKAHADYQFRR